MNIHNRIDPYCAGQRPRHSVAARPQVAVNLEDLAWFSSVDPLDTNNDVTGRDINHVAPHEKRLANTRQRDRGATRHERGS